MGALRAVCVFCGSSAPPDPRYRDTARALGTMLARENVTVVYGGSRVGLMGELADAALGHGGRVIGVVPAGLFVSNHMGLTELHEVPSMHDRKRLMYDLSDAFIALPGGLGTLEELAEVSAWSQLGLHTKPVVLLDVDGFWGPLAAQLDRMVGAGLLKPASRALIQWAHSADEALAVLAAAQSAD
ncbi:MAG TPA: TIGR00730 family Rossman fold protein [Streptosporangiaceae bacterium]|nr:TIGR00730 family Rossman fold protein [Streptosporangiaceae bacterium]